MTRLLMIDDDVKLVALLGEYLHPQGFELDVAYDGPSGLAAARADQPALVILDVMLPGLDGLEVCRQLRQTSRVPVLMLTARGDETDRIVGLEMGADDYLPKPFSPRELLARVRAILRRTGGSGEGSGQEAGQRGDGAGALARVVVGPVTIDPAARRVTLGGREIDLTTAEFDLFHALARCAGRVLSRDDLLQQVHGPGWAAYSRSVDVHISRIRQKVEVDARQPVLLKTVRGVGYMLCRIETNDGHLEVRT